MDGVGDGSRGTGEPGGDSTLIESLASLEISCESLGEPSSAAEEYQIEERGEIKLAVEHDEVEEGVRDPEVPTCKFRRGHTLAVGLRLKG